MINRMTLDKFCKPLRFLLIMLFLCFNIKPIALQGMILIVEEFYFLLNKVSLFRNIDPQFTVLCIKTAINITEPLTCTISVIYITSYIQFSVHFGDNFQQTIWQAGGPIFHYKVYAIMIIQMSNFLKKAYTDTFGPNVPYYVSNSGNLSNNKTNVLGLNTELSNDAYLLAIVFYISNTGPVAIGVSCFLNILKSVNLFFEIMFFKR